MEYGPPEGAVFLTPISSLHTPPQTSIAAALCLSPTHEFRFMLVNQIQRDMNR
jgi:hypothetical protein